ncbi:MAG: TRAP transporter small permease subunit [Rhizobiales bacterium]|nr:TRAP transporter small permease subunit [Hyphomicrobiales bacterium]
MPSFLRWYVRIVDGFNRLVGRATMYLIFVMMAVLFYSALSKLPWFSPSLWTLEVAQFLMVAYFLLGGPYSMQQNEHVRMDLLYGAWSDRTRAWVDAFTVLFLIFYLFWLLAGAVSSTQYAIAYGERSYSAWRPYMWPIKVVMTFAIFLMLLQAISALIKDVAKLRGEEL